MKKSSKNHEIQKLEKKLIDYWPLISLILVAALAGFAICYGNQQNFMNWMHYFMGLLFCQFAMLKLFDISSFADGFQMYDLIAKKNRYYALSYPFIELLLGIAFLSKIMPSVTYVLTIIFMSIGIIGVIIALRKGLNTYCACMGSVLKVPLSSVTLIEDIGMGVMALLMIILRQF